MLIESRQDILRRLGIGLREGAFFIRCTDSAAALDRPAGQRGAEHIGIVVAAGIGVDSRRAAELAPGEDQG